MKIALGQMRVLPGQPDSNFEQMKRRIDEARNAGCSIIAFPEMCVGGYLLGDRWTESCWCDYLCSFNEKICELSEDIVVIYGNIFVDKSKKNKDGRIRKYNAGFVYYNKKPAPRSGNLPEGVAFKSLLPNYRIFDDERYFFSLQELSEDMCIPIEELLQPFTITIDSTQYRFGVEICEDLWFNDYRYQGKPLNISSFLIKNGAEFIFNLSSSPWTYGKDRARNNRIQDSYKDCSKFVPFYYVNCVGVQNNGKNIVVFDGDSTIYNDKAEVVLTSSKPFNDELIIFESDKACKPITKKSPTIIESKFNAVIEGIRGMDELVGNSTFPYIVGISGGIDSALSACLLSKAIGSHRVIGVNLPTRYNSEKTKTIAKNLSEKLGIKFYTIPIEEMVTINTSLLDQFNPTEFNLENVQAKIRGTSILSNIAGILKGLMTCNGNKIEIALGYATLYGDVNGAIAPLGDLLKTEVFQMARYLNESVFKDGVIPSMLLPDENFEFAMPPSAELKANQIDPMKWGYHDALIQQFTDYQKTGAEEILQWYIDGTLCEKLGLSINLFNKYNLGNPTLFIEDLEWVLRSMQAAVFKRIQSPPIIILSKSSYGYDIRESQLQVYYSDRYKELKKQILLNTK